MINVSLAFIIFGIIDNGIMIIAGDAINRNIGSILGFSVLLSAGLGNLLSDVAGILIGRLIEAQIFSNKNIGEGLTSFQSITAEVIGIILGCLIGLFPLLFINY